VRALTAAILELTGCHGARAPASSARLGLAGDSLALRSA
jgi:hypothetical protein